MDILGWGTGNTARTAMQYFKKDINILAFIETIPKAKEFMGKRVIDISEIRDYKYDYIVVLSKFIDEIEIIIKALEIDREKVIFWNSAQFFEYSEFARNHFYNRYKEFENQREKIELLVTGISYHNDGIDCRMFPVKAFNFALRAQDLFYDFEIVKFINEQKKEKCDLKYVIIGLNYYSFEYDFSKSSNCKEIIRYFPWIPDPHNMLSQEYFEGFVLQERERLSKYQYYEKIFEIKMPEYNLNDEEGKKAAAADFNKHYPLTIYENKAILVDFIQYLKINNIKPVILIMPATKYYTKYCPIEKRELFENTLNEVLKGYNIQVLNYFDSYDCPDSDYYHITHFNKKGAGRFTRKLAGDINW